MTRVLRTSVLSTLLVVLGATCVPSGPESKEAVAPQSMKPEPPEAAEPLAPAPPTLPEAPPPPPFTDRLLPFDDERLRLTGEYLRVHGGRELTGDLVVDASIVPRVVVLHWTGGATADGAWATFAPTRLGSRPELVDAGALNVGAHFLVDRDGTTWRLIPEGREARHAIGLNHVAIGIENVGGHPGRSADRGPDRRERRARSRSGPALPDHLPHWPLRAAGDGGPPLLRGDGP